MFDHPDDQPGVTSARVPNNEVTRRLRQVTDFANWLDELRPDAQDAWEILPFT